MARAPIPSAVLFALAAIAAIAFWPNVASAAESETTPPDEGDDYPVFGDDMQLANLRAFLYMIRAAEHTPAVAASADAYSTVYGGARVQSLEDHPAVTGEWRGKPLPDAMCAAAGFGPGCVSTAAGAYQIIKPTWQRVRRPGAWGPYLIDFSAENQDEAARRLLIERQALPLVLSGEIEAAIARAAPEWASLPGSTAKQRPKSVDTVLAYFNTGLQMG